MTAFKIQDSVIWTDSIQTAILVATLLPFWGGIESPTWHQTVGITNSVFRFLITQGEFY